MSFRAPEGFVPWPDQQLKLLFPPPGRDLVLPRAPAEGDGMTWYLAG